MKVVMQGISPHSLPKQLLLKDIIRDYLKKKKEKGLTKVLKFLAMVKILKKRLGMKSRKIENSCEFLDYMYYDQVNKSNWFKVMGKFLNKEFFVDQGINNDVIVIVKIGE